MANSFCSSTSFFQLKGKRFPFLGLVLAAILGIAVEDFFSFSSAWTFWVSLFLGIVLLVSSYVWRRSIPSKIARGFFFLFVAFCFATLHAWQWQESSARQVASLLKGSDETVVATGIVASPITLSSSKNASFFLEVKKLAIGSLQVEVPVTMLVRWEGPLPSYGDEVTLRATAQAPLPPRNPGEFDAAMWLARKEVFTELKMDPSDPGVIVASTEHYKIRRWAEISREHVEQLLCLGIADNPTIVTMIKGIVLGCKEYELGNFLDDFKLTGTMHLFAVSGLHVGMLAMIIWFFLKLVRLPRRFAAAVTIPLLFFYVAITGFRIGSLRAALMASLVLTGFLFYRRPQMINSLAAAAFCLLIFETNLLFSMGWQFSFCVVFSILLLATPFQRMLHPLYETDPLIPKKLITPFQHARYKTLHHLAQLLAVSSAAWIGSLVPSVFYFHLISFSALGANIVAVPLAFVILSLAAVSLVFGFFSPWVATIFNNTNWLCAKILLLVIHGFTLLPGNSCSIGILKPTYPTFTIFDFPSAQAAMLQTEGKTWFINVGRSKNATQTLFSFLQEKGITMLQGLVFTEQEAAHLGGAIALIEKFPPAAVVSAAGEGSSFLFKHLKQQLSASHQKWTLLHAGDRLDFSPSCWGEILYPSENSLESALIFKLHLGTTTFLLLPSTSPLLETWLLEHCSRETLHATILVLPAIDERLLLHDPLLATVAPRAVVVGSSSFKHHDPVIVEEVTASLKERGIRLLDQDQTGAVIIESLPEKVRVHGFFNKMSLEYEIPALD